MEKPVLSDPAIFPTDEVLFFKKSAGKKIRGITVVIKRKQDVRVYKGTLALKMATV